MERALLDGAGLACSASFALRWRFCPWHGLRSSNWRLEASPVKARRRAGLVDAWSIRVFALLVAEVLMVCSRCATVDWWVGLREVGGAK
jgi:hypothetical protein